MFVDVFLLLSGFLFCRILLIELERRQGKLNVLILYVGRYIRLTPAYLAIIGFYMTWFPSMGSGPLWQQRIEREQERCQSSWWTNILYINNYINSDKLVSIYLHFFLLRIYIICKQDIMRWMREQTKSFIIKLAWTVKSRLFQKSDLV